MEAMLIFFEKLTGKHIHLFNLPSKIIYPLTEVYGCRCGVKKQIKKVGV